MKTKSILLFACIIIATSSFAQGRLLENWAVGLNAGLYGYGIQGATSLAPNFKARIGFDYMAYTYKDGIEFDADVLKNGELLDYTYSGEFSTAKLQFPNVKAMIDYYPMKTGVFCFTAGVYFGNNKISLNGKVYDYSHNPDRPNIGFEDVIIQPNSDGSFDANLKLGNFVKPYFGIGLGRTIPKSRVGFKFELGIVYQGEFRLESKNAISHNGYSTSDFFDDLDDLPVSKEVFKLWPMMNFTLSYKIK